MRERIALLLDEGSFAEEALLAELAGGGAGRRRGRDGRRDGRRQDGRADGQRPDREGGVVGPEDGREDPAHPGTGAAAAGADGLPGGLGRRADHRAGADVPGPARGGADLLQRGADVGRRAAGVRAVRAERRRRRVHPGVLRRRDHARGQRVDVSGLAADGRDGDRREGEPGGDGRREDAHGRERVRASAGEDRRGGNRAREEISRVHAEQLGAAAHAAGQARGARVERRRSRRSCRRTRTSRST